MASHNQDLLFDSHRGNRSSPSCQRTSPSRIRRAHRLAYEPRSSESKPCANDRSHPVKRLRAVRALDPTLGGVRNRTPEPDAGTCGTEGTNCCYPCPARRKSGPPPRSHRDRRRRDSVQNARRLRGYDSRLRRRGGRATLLSTCNRAWIAGVRSMVDKRRVQEAVYDVIRWLRRGSRYCSFSPPQLAVHSPSVSAAPSMRLSEFEE